MRIHALLNGRPVQIVNIERAGSQVHVVYIDSATISPGGLVSTQMSVSAFGTPDIVISTSATFLG